MPVHPDLQPIVELAHGGDQPTVAELGVDGLRANLAAFSRLMGEGPAGVQAHDDVVAGRGGPVPVRRYRPVGAPAGPLGCLVFLHGGGFVIGDLDTHDALCRRLAVDAGIVVVSVDYRLAPEHRFPAAVEDGVDALAVVMSRAEEWGIDPARVAVGGDSAGGNLAAVVARHWRDDGTPPLRLQLLVYPVCDLTHDTARFPSLADNGEGFILTSETMRFFADTYLPEGADPADPDASPLSAGDLSGLPPALVITAELDPLRDEGEAYAARLAEAGVPTTLTRYDGAVHLFFQLGELTSIGAEAVARAVDALRAALS